MRPVWVGRTLAGLLALMALTVAWQPAQSQVSPMILRLETTGGKNHFRLGERFDLLVKYENFVAIGGFDVKIQYDPQVLKLTEFMVNTGINDANGADINFLPCTSSSQPNSGIFEETYAVKGNGSGYPSFSGNGTLITLHMQAVVPFKSGQTTIDFAKPATGGILSMWVLHPPKTVPDPEFVLPDPDLFGIAPTIDITTLFFPLVIN